MTVSRCQLIALACALMVSACASSGPRKLSKDEQAAIYVDAANADLRGGQPVAALQDLQEAEKLSPKMPELFHTRALVYVTRGESDKAIIAARKAVELNPKYSAAQTTLGKLLMDAGQSEEAIPYLVAAAKDDLYPEAYKPLTSLGILYYRKMEIAKASAYFEKAIATDPQGACIAYYYRGHVHLHNGEIRQAIADYDQATRRFCAGFAEAHLALGIAYERDKQYTAARKKFLEIKDHFSSSSVAEQAMSHLKYLP